MGVGAVVVRDGKVLLIRRGKRPLRGRWMVPGGTVELGETLEQALVRETREETGLIVRPREPVAVLDRIQREDGRVRFHYVIVDFVCDYVSGSARAGSDAQELAFVSPAELSSYRLPRAALQAVVEGLNRVGASARRPNDLPPRSDASRMFKSILACSE